MVPPRTEAELGAAVWGSEHNLSVRGVRITLAPALATLMSAFVLKRLPDGRYAPRIVRTDMGGSERSSVLETWKPGDPQPANPAWAAKRGMKPYQCRGADTALKKKPCKACGNDRFVLCRDCDGSGVSDGDICSACRGDGAVDCPDCAL